MGGLSAMQVREYEVQQLKQYKKASCILNVELMAKIALLEKETHCYEDFTKANTNLTTELATLHEQMEQVKVDAMAGFRTSQLYYDECGSFYGDGFDDYLKQVAALYFYLDLSQVVIEDTVLPTFGGTEAVMDKANGSFTLTAPFTWLRKR